MSRELDALEALAANYTSGIYRITPLSLAVLFYATRFWSIKRNWLSNSPLDEITDEQWDRIQAYTDGLLYEVKNPLLGYIMPYATESPPPNVLPCDGATYLRETYPALYEVLDTFFIIDSDHFKVPDLRGRVVLGVGNGAGLTPYNTGDTGGEEKHQLTEGELASHSHSIPTTATTLAVEPGEVTVLTPIPIITSSTGSTGGDQSHENRQPYFALNYGIIAS